LNGDKSILIITQECIDTKNDKSKLSKLLGSEQGQYQERDDDKEEGCIGWKKKS